MASAPEPHPPRRRLAFFGAALVALTQAAWGLLGIDNLWQWGHNGYNNAAYLVAARNSLRWGELFPAQYIVGPQAPTPHDLYTHAPRGLHLHLTAAVALLGDANWVIRLVPALLGLLATLALLGIVWRRWSPAHAVLAGAIYVLLPINHAFANMVNHSTGFILGSLLTLECYLRWIEATTPSRARWAWLAGLHAAAAYAMLWDWPAYYVMFAVAVHWFYRSFDPATLKRPLRLGLNSQHLALALFSAWVLASFVGFFALVYAVVGSFDEVAHSFSNRHEAPPAIWKTLWSFTLQPMLSTPLLTLGLLWTLGWVVRHASRSLQGRDLIPAAFLFAGLLHTLLFRATAIIHVYWVWPFNPGLAIAAATTLLAFAARLRDALPTPHNPRLAKALAAAITLAVLTPPLAAFLHHTLPLLPEGRRVAGTFNHTGYQSDLLRMRFGEAVHAWTTPRTGVLMPHNFHRRIELLATLDRLHAPTPRVDRIQPPDLPAEDGWVVLGPAQLTPRSQIVAAAAKHPYWQLGLYYMIDYRREGVDVRIWNLEPDPDPPLSWRLLHNPTEGPWIATRVPDAEARLLQEIQAAKLR